MFELTLYGATGFTGRLAAQYITASYPKLKWAIAGRSEAKLKALQAECDGKPSIVLADAQDEAALRKLAAGTAVVVACAGPFSQYGSKLVACCAAAGTDYCDITGEIPWVREMIAAHDDTARKSGARIVHLCGHDSIPWDLSTLMLANKLAEKNEQLKRVDFYDDIVSAPSGGTLTTAMGLMFGGAGKPGPAQKALGYDALLKPAQGTEPASTVKARNVKYLDTKGKRPRVNFFMSGVNASAVKRSNALNHYSDSPVVYCEGWACSNLLVALWSIVKTTVLGLLMLCPPTRWVLLQFLPKPGEGPSKESMDAGYLTVHGIATGSGGSTVQSTMHFSTDPGYKDTARMVVESALALSLDKVKCPGGVFTPAACQKEVLLKRLQATGTTFSFH